MFFRIPNATGIWTVYSFEAILSICCNLLSTPVAEPGVVRDKNRLNKFQTSQYIWICDRERNKIFRVKQEITFSAIAQFKLLEHFKSTKRVNEVVVRCFVAYNGIN